MTADVMPWRRVLEVPFNADFSQHHGYMHAGVITTGMDSACGFAAFTLMDADAEVLTVEFMSSFIAPARQSLSTGFLRRAECHSL